MNMLILFGWTKLYSIAKYRCPIRAHCTLDCLYLVHNRALTGGLNAMRFAWVSVTRVLSTNFTWLE